MWKSKQHTMMDIQNICAAITNSNDFSSAAATILMQSRGDARMNLRVRYICIGCIMYNAADSLVEMYESADKRPQQQLIPTTY